MQDVRALVVDDSKVGRLTMMKKLEAIGVKVDLAESGQHALDYLAQHRPDMIFMDHMMPEMDGFEVTRRIKASPAIRDIPVIIVSGNDEATFLQESRAAGAIDAITKPPATGVLENLLASLPKLSAEAPVAEVAPVVAEAPQPAVIEPAPSIDMAEVHTLLERLVGAAVAPLHDDFMAEIGQYLEVESGNQRKKLAEWGERLNHQAATMEELGRGVVDAETLGNRLQALEQRLLPLEAEAARPQPDFDALRADIDQRLAARFAESDARTDKLAPELESLRRDLHDMQARLDQHAAQAEQKASEWSSKWSSEWVGRLDTLEADQARVSQDVQSIRSTQAEYEQRIDQSIAQVRETLDAAEQAAAAVPEVAGEAAVSVASADIQAMQAELDELRERLSESRLQQLVAETVGNLLPAAEAQPAVVEPPAPPVGSENLQAELDELREHLSESRLRQLVEETVGNLLPAAEAQHAVVEPVGSDNLKAELDELRERLSESRLRQVGSENLQAELTQLRKKVKSLTVATAVGGALLLVAIGIAVFGG
jgi:CheY-like chemotaxis protein